MPLSPAARLRAMFAFIGLIWGTTWLAMKIGIATVPPGVFAGLRWLTAGLILMLWLRWRGERILPPPRLVWRLIGVSILLVTLNQVIQLYGLLHITAGLAAVISSGLTPIFLLMFSVGLGQERLSWRQVGAITLGVAGVLLLFGPDAVAGTLDVWEVIGASGVVIGCLSYSLGSVLTRPMMRQLAPIQLAALTDVIGGGILLIFSVPLEPGGWAALSFQWGWPAFLAWLYLVIPAALMATTMYFLLVREWGASRPGTYAFISPVIAVVLGSSLFGETLDWGHGIGMTLMLCGAGLALRRRV